MGFYDIVKERSQPDVILELKFPGETEDDTTTFFVHRLPQKQINIANTKARAFCDANGVPRDSMTASLGYALARERVAYIKDAIQKVLVGDKELEKSDVEMIFENLSDDEEILIASEYLKVAEERHRLAEGNGHMSGKALRKRSGKD